MRIRELHINRFGHFQDCGLKFEGPGLQVIHGPNEAGKTTLLEFLRGLLFDFPARTPYDFGGPGKMSGTAVVELRDGRTVELRRRKGNKDKVSLKIDGQSTDLDDSGWIRLLDHADRTLFETVFAFGLDQLSQGEATLKHDSVQSALFGGSLGGTVSPDQILTDLSKQADDLFKKGGSRPAINACLAEIKNLSKQMRERSLRPEKFHEAQQAVESTAQRAQEIATQVEDLRRQHAHIEKLVRAFPMYWELQQRRKEREACLLTPHITPHSGQVYAELRKTLAALEAQHTELQAEIQPLTERLRQVTLDPAAVSYRTEIKACLELRQSYIEARQDLPQRQQHRKEVLQTIDRELAELRPGWTHDDLRAFSIDFETREKLERLSQEVRERTTIRTKLLARRDTDRDAAQQARDELAEIGEPPDVTILMGILQNEAEYLADRKQQMTLADELSKLDRKLARQLHKLAPPLDSATPEAAELAVPRTETVEEFEGRFDALAEQIRILEVALKDETTRQHDLQTALQAAGSKRSVPSLDQKNAARQHRDSGWELIRKRYFEEADNDAECRDWLGTADPSDLSAAYENAVRNADQLADEIFDNAHEVAEREGMRRQLQAVSQRIEFQQQSLGQFGQQQNTLQTEWEHLWRACGLTPLAPAAMLSWLAEHARARELLQQRDDLAQTQQQTQQRVQSFQDQVETAGTSRTQADPAAQLSVVRNTVDEAREQQRRVKELQKQIRRLDQQLQQHDRELTDLDAATLTAQAEQTALLGQLNLPEAWDLNLAGKVIEKLSATRVRLDGLPGEDARIVAMQTRIDEFTQRVAALCVAVQPELQHDPVDLAIGKLDEQAEKACEAERHQTQLSHRLEQARSQLEAVQVQAKAQEDERTRLFGLAGVQTDAEFLSVVEQAKKAQNLDSEIDRLTRDIDLIRAGEEAADFDQSLQERDLTVLQKEELDLRERLNVVETQRRTADGDERVAREELKRLQGSEEVAALTEQLSRQRAVLTAEVDRYLPIIYARHLLKAAVSRFEKENQPEMIATVSRLLGQMTGGRYVEFDRFSSGKQGLLIRGADGVEKTPDQLSTGTREQLYLAIRLAYVLHYSKKNQPLPIVIDDVLVNFDDERTRHTFNTLAEISKSVQVLFFTCHPHMVEIAREVLPGLQPIDLKQISPQPALFGPVA